MRIYLAGPDVFHPKAEALGAEKAAICRALDLIPVFPLDELVPPDGRTPPEHGLAIAAKDLRLARSCDACLINLTPYHGPSMDVGSAVELGLMCGLGRPLFGYTNDARPFPERAAPQGPGWRPEPFGLVDNLMVEGAIRDSGGAVFTPAETRAFEDLTTFRQAAEALAAFAR